MQIQQTVYHIAAKRNWHELLFDLLKLKGDVDARDVSGKTALHLALGVKSINCVKVLSH